MPRPSRNSQITAVGAAITEFADKMLDMDGLLIGEDMDTKIINLLVALRFLSDRFDINFDLCVRTSAQTFHEENV